jgi:hypothetical protein
MKRPDTPGNPIVLLSGIGYFQADYSRSGFGGLPEKRRK